MLSIIVLFFSLTVVSGEDCAPLALGCYTAKDEHILFSDKAADTTLDYFSGQLVDWTNYNTYLLEAACRCEKEAIKANYKYFSLKRFGQCSGIGKGKDKFEKLSLKPSAVCIAPNLQQCEKKHKKCVGAEGDEFVYQVTMEPGPTVVDGGYTEWSTWSVCTKSCGGGLQERERSCTNPKPSGDGAKDCGVIGKPADMRKCNQHKCPGVDPKPEDTYHNVVFCESETAKTVKCAHKNQVITVLGANYGRLTVEFCQRNHFRQTNCRSDRSDLKIKRMCNGKNSCSIKPSNSVFGDPCKGVFKYVSMKYKCSFKDFSLHRGVFCEYNRHTKPSIKCTGGKKIIIVGANYGRLSVEYCRKEGNYLRTNCRSEKSHQKIRDMCNGKEECRIDASHHVYGDPCRGISKYVSVEYQCH